MDRYRSFYLDTGQTLSYLRSAEVAFDIAMLAGEAEHACDVAEEAWRSLNELGDSWPYLAAFLGQGRYAVGRYEDAREPAAFAAEHGDEIERSLALGVLAKLAARPGDAPAALETIAEAVARVDRTDFLFDRGTVHTDRGETLRLLGREDEALSAFDEAIGLFDQKGDVVSSERVRRLRAAAMP
jgi:tetratricopeptide (TPR) repeat protein